MDIDGLLIKDWDPVYENQIFTGSLSFFGDVSVLFINCTFDCDDIDFADNVTVTFQRCTINTNRFHTGTFTVANVPTDYAVEINLIESNLFIRPVADPKNPFQVASHQNFVFQGTSIVQINDSIVISASQTLEPHEDTQLIIHNSIINVTNLQIFERADVSIENSIVNSGIVSIADFYNLTPPHNPSLLISNSQINALLWNCGLNSTVTLQNSTVDMLGELIWVKGSLIFENNNITAGTSFGVTTFNIDESSSYNELSYSIVGIENAIIQIESSVLYALVSSYYAKIHLANSIVIDFVSAAGKSEVFIQNSTLLGEGRSGNVFGVLNGWAAMAITGYTMLAESLIYLIDCTICGEILPNVEMTIILQNCHFGLGQWNDTVIPFFVTASTIVVIDSESPQYLAGDVSFDIFGSYGFWPSYDITDADLYVNSDLVATPELLTTTSYRWSNMGKLLVSQPYLHFSYDFSAISGMVDFILAVKHLGSVIYTRNFTLEVQSQPSIVQLLQQLCVSITQLDDSAFDKNPSQRKATLCNKIQEVIDLVELNNYTDTYDQLLHDLKPKLTGLKTDENECPWGNGVFNNPWIIDPNIQELLRIQCNQILVELKLAQ